MRPIIGVDPGASGAVALLDKDNKVTVWDVPCVVVKRGVKKVKGRSVPRMVRELDEEKYAQLIFSVPQLCGGEAVIEKVHAMPDQGSSSGFAFGQIFGQMKMAFTCAEIKYHLVTPAKWKMAMGCGASKDSSLLACLDAFPGHDHLWIGPRGATLDGRCEAALLALYGRKYLGIT